MHDFPLFCSLPTTHLKTIVRFAGLESALTVACVPGRKPGERSIYAGWCIGMKLQPLQKALWRSSLLQQGIPQEEVVLASYDGHHPCPRGAGRYRYPVMGPWRNAGTGERERGREGLLTSCTNEAVFWLLCLAKDAISRRFQAGPASAEAAPAATATAAAGPEGAAMEHPPMSGPRPFNTVPDLSVGVPCVFSAV